MKLFAPALGIALLAVSSAATAIPISVVGGADSLVDWTKLDNSDPVDEKQFIASYLNVNASTITYTQLSGSGASSWLTVNEDPSLYAFDFGGASPSLFIVKTGNKVGLPNETGTFTHFLFSNVGSSLFGVIDMDLFTRTSGNVEIGMVSHVGTSGTTTSVPEPGTLGLFGLAAAALGFTRLRGKFAKR